MGKKMKYKEAFKIAVAEGKKIRPIYWDSAKWLKFDFEEMRLLCDRGIFCDIDNFDYDDDFEVIEEPKMVYEWRSRFTEKCLWKIHHELMSEGRAEDFFSDCFKYEKTGREFPE